MNVFHTPEPYRNQGFLFQNSGIFLLVCALLCGAILVLLLPVTIPGYPEQTCPLGNEDHSCVSQVLSDAAPSGRAPGERQRRFTVEPVPNVSHHIDDRKQCTQSRCEALYEPQDQQTTLPVFREYYSNGTSNETEKTQFANHRWISVEQMGPASIGLYTTHYNKRSHGQKNGVGTFKGISHVQINAPEYSAG
jgi:hypothetical protein